MSMNYKVEKISKGSMSLSITPKKKVEMSNPDEWKLGEVRDAISKKTPTLEKISKGSLLLKF